MAKIYVFLFLAVQFSIHAQVFRSFINTNDVVVNAAVDFYASYLAEFQNEEPVDYKKYWTSDSFENFKNPDLAVYAINSDYPVYKFSAETTIYYAKRIDDHVHIKSILSYKSYDSTNTVFAILNHYVKIPVSENETFKFVPIFSLTRSDYTQKKFGSITYHFPVKSRFNKSKARDLKVRTEKIVKAWGFTPLEISYYYTETAEEMSRMRGFEYRYGDEQTTPNGISYPQERLLFSVGSGEDNLHEVLHIYFNPKDEKSPVNHALIYYLAGGLGHDFQWFINRLNEYLLKYPATDLSQFDTIETKDIMLHIDFTVLGIVCKIIDAKDGVDGLRRLLQYETVDLLFETESGLKREGWNAFLKKQIENFKG